MGSFTSSDMSKMNYFFPFTSIPFLPIPVFSNQKSGTQLSSCPLHATNLGAVSSPSGIPLVLLSPPLHALGQALMLCLSALTIASSSDLCFLILPDQICSATRAVTPKHRSGLTLPMWKYLKFANWFLRSMPTFSSAHKGIRGLACLLSSVTLHRAIPNSPL